MGNQRDLLNIPSPVTPPYARRTAALEVRATGDAARPDNVPQSPRGDARDCHGTHGAPQTPLPDGILVHEALDARVAQAPEALGDELQAGRQAVRLRRVPAGQLHGVRRLLQDVQDSLEDSPGRRLSKKRIELLHNKK